MNGEILSIETAQKIARLEKENKELSDIINKFDKEVNRLFHIIKTSYEYIDKKVLYSKDEQKVLKSIIAKGLSNGVDKIV